jgi:hypothetical protein
MKIMSLNGYIKANPSGRLLLLGLMQLVQDLMQFLELILQPLKPKVTKNQ